LTVLQSGCARIAWLLKTGKTKKLAT